MPVRTSDAVKRALEALAVDVVVSVAQARAMYGVQRAELANEGAFFAWHGVRSGTRARKRVTVEFVSLEARVGQLRVMQVMHFAGTAALRHVLGVEPSAWGSKAGAFAASFRPDALWHHPDGLVAVEYDAGSYSRKTVRQKLVAFDGGEFTGGQVWGTVTPARARFVEGVASELGIERVRVLPAPWLTS